MIYHIKRYKPLHDTARFITEIEEGCEDFPSLNVMSLNHWKEPRCIVGDEIWVDDIDAVSALKRACKMFKLAEERDTKNCWRDELGRVSL